MALASALASLSLDNSDDWRAVGAFERAYEVDGEHFELYTDGSSRFQLVDEEGFPVGDPFWCVPSESVIAALVRASRDTSDPSAA